MIFCHGPSCDIGNSGITQRRVTVLPYIMPSNRDSFEELHDTILPDDISIITRHMTDVHGIQNNH